MISVRNQFIPNMVLINGDYEGEYSGGVNIDHVGDTTGVYIDAAGNEWSWDDGTFYEMGPGWYNQYGEYSEFVQSDWEWHSY